MGAYHRGMEEEKPMKPSARRILDLLRSQPIRYLPKRAWIETEGNEPLRGTLLLLGCKWEWSRTIDLETNTSDYRKRISEINGMDGYTILSFHAPHKLEGGGTITRHGYILVAEPQTEGKAG